MISLSRRGCCKPRRQPFSCSRQSPFPASRPARCHATAELTGRSSLEVEPAGRCRCRPAICIRYAQTHHTPSRHSECPILCKPTARKLTRIFRCVAVHVATLLVSKKAGPPTTGDTLVRLGLRSSRRSLATPGANLPVALAQTDGGPGECQTAYSPHFGHRCDSGLLAAARHRWPLSHWQSYIAGSPHAGQSFPYVSTAH